MADLLSEDVLSNIISCLAPRYLTMCRCVSKTWCAIIDAHNLLRVDLLPHSVCGIFINFNELSASEFFSRPSKGPTVSGNFDYMPCRSCISDHCNGLLLLYNAVVNPATQQWAPLPPYPSPSMAEEHFSRRDYLVFDPTLSPHYEDNAVYWRGVLYVNCQTKLVMRLSLSDGKYQVIKPPVADEEMGCTALYLGQSEKGVYCALCSPSIFGIYILDESTGKMDWIFKHSCNVWSIISYQTIDGPGPWTLQDINYQDFRDEYEDGNNEAIVEEKYDGTQTVIMLLTPKQGANVDLIVILTFLDFTLTRRLSS